MWFTLLLIAGVAFTGYAIYTYYSRTSVYDSLPKRIWAALVLAAAAIAAWVTAFFQQGGVPS